MQFFKQILEPMGGKDYKVSLWKILIFFSEFQVPSWIWLKIENVVYHKNH